MAKIIPLYTTKGDAEAFLVYPYIYNRLGEWIGWITAEKEIYSVIGHYVGFLAKGPRILRKRAIEIATEHKRPPVSPAGKVYPPATVPLAPMMPELNHSEIDILLDEPERLHTADSGEFREDLD
ncbi:MAG: hypothetical protein HN392_06135 [Anaerolineae bacterium]|jgi:hypothetical protein|nr:hypothetical protein [Anaerolineae bacterium]MBT7073741.1 hypothetical protein [Anaerolineae bacterium]MBT7782175.1 hypothetical protein [Anaerolineae bacterium]